MAKAIETLGAMAYDNLFANVDVKALTGSAVVASGAGVLARGTVVALDGEKLVAMTTGKTPYGILTDEVDATSADAVAEVYLSGYFNKNALICAKGYTLTAADIQALRDVGIYVEISVK